MSIEEERLRSQWRADLARIAAEIDDLKTRIQNESRMLYAKLSEEIAALQAELENLEAEVEAAGPDSYARQIAVQIEELRAKGDAAYDLLQTGMSFQLDPADAEIRRLEAIAATVSGDARSRITARIDELKSARAAAQAKDHPVDWTTESYGDSPN